MVLTHLSLTHFRNYRTLEIDFSGDLTLLQGENAQGKTNLLEAIYFSGDQQTCSRQTRPRSGRLGCD